MLFYDTASYIAELGEFLKSSRLADRVILELSSKYYWRRGRQQRRANDLIIADRLLQAGLLADPDDVVWTSRRIDIAFERRAWDDARRMIDAAARKHPGDQIVKFQAGRLELFEGRADAARAILQKLIDKQTAVGDGSAVDFHPAVVDQIALASLRQRRFDEAENYYQMNLERQKLDPRPWIGLGRVCFERGKNFWPQALQNWGQALILQSEWNSYSFERFAGNTASLIGGLFRSHSADGRLLERLEALVAREPNVLRFLGTTLGSKRIPSSTLFTLMRVAESAGDKLVQRSMAQLLRARSLHALCSTSSESLRTEVAAHVEWCLKVGVLSDYLAGSKGSYARVLLQPHSALIGVETRVYSGFWKSLAEHISKDGYVAGYYSKAERLVGDIVSAPPSEIVEFSLWLSSYVLQQLKASIDYPEKLIERLRADIVLAAPSDLGKLDESRPPQVSALVDEDIFRVAQRFINGSGWRDGGAEIARSIHRSPNPELMFQCSRGGIFFRPQSATAEAEAYINVLPQTSRATYELENSRLGH